jgi:cytochrome P450
VSSEASILHHLSLTSLFTIAGRDTTAQTLTWVFWNLANNPEVEKKARAEVQAVLNGKEPDYESIKELKYLNAIFNETLRLQANVPGNILTCTKDTVLAGTGTQVYRGDLVQYSPWVMVRCPYIDSSLWNLTLTFAIFQGRMTSIWGPDAEEFKPERWIDEKGSLKKENQFKWPVFKAGPRICLGMNSE